MHRLLCIFWCSIYESIMNLNGCFDKITKIDLIDFGSLNGLWVGWCFNSIWFFHFKPIVKMSIKSYIYHEICTLTPYSQWASIETHSDRLLLFKTVSWRTYKLYLHLKRFHEFEIFFELSEYELDIVRLKYEFPVKPIIAFFSCDLRHQSKWITWIAGNQGFVPELTHPL